MKKLHLILLLILALSACKAPVYVIGMDEDINGVMLIKSGL